MNKQKSDIEVYETTDYELFGLYEENRKVSRAHVLKLKLAIQKKNLLNLYPIVVSADGKVLDGQHRLAAATELGVPIYYIVSENGANISDMAITNSTTKKWVRRDYLHHWVSQGKEHYRVLNDFWKKYDWMSLSVACAICIGEPANKTLPKEARIAFENGEYLVTDMRFATMFAAAIKDFLVHFEYAKERPFMAAMSKLLRHPKYKQDIMKKRLEAYPGFFVRCPDGERYIELLTRLYNYHSRSKVKFD